MRTEAKEIYFPEVGDKLYCFQITNDQWVNDVKRPFTVISVSNDTVVIQECELIFSPTNNYFDSYPIDIKENPTGSKMTLVWCPKRGLWGNREGYFAKFGKWEYAPYLN